MLLLSKYDVRQTVIGDRNGTLNYFSVALVQLPVHGCPGRLKAEMDEREMKERSETEVRIFSFYTHKGNLEGAALQEMIQREAVCKHRFSLLHLSNQVLMVLARW